MKNLKYLLAFPVLALAAVMGTACDDENEEPRMELPSIEVGEVALASETESKVVVTVTPSENTETWYWKCEAVAGETASYTSVAGHEKTELSIPIALDRDYTLTVYAENELGKSEEVAKDFRIASADLKGELVSFEIKHLSAVSVDVEVKKNIKCTRYAIGAVPKYSDMDGAQAENYDEATFIESAQRSLNPDPDYPFQAYNTSDESGVFTELTLNKASAAEGVNTGLVFTSGETYVVGVYALDAAGEGKLFTQEFVVPDMDVTKGTSEVKITVNEEDMTLTSVAATFSADANCAKIITSIVHKSTLVNSKFYEMEEAEKLVYLASNTAQCPQPYTGEFRREFQTEFSPNTEYVIWAVPVDVDGNIGKVVYHEGVTPGFSLDGKGEITAAAITQTSYESVNISLTLNEEAEKVRLIFLDAMSFGTNVGNDLNWVMYDESLKHLWVEEKEFDASEAGNIVVDSYSPGAYYCVYAATVDAEGKVSEPVNVAVLAGVGADNDGYFASMPEPEAEGITFDGTGELEVTANESDVDGDGMFNADFEVTLGNNTQKAYYIRVGEGFNTEEDINAAAQEAFANYPDEIGPSAHELEFEGGTTTFSLDYMLPYDSSWGGALVIFVTEDVNGKLAISNVYVAGLGMQ